MIRILHTSDWHLGQTFFGYERTEEHEHFLDWLAGCLRSEQVDVLVVAGDVYDVSNPSAAAQLMFYRFISRVTRENPTLQLVVIAGNHDSAARLEAPLPLLQEMRTAIKGVVRKKEGEIDYEDMIVELCNSQGEAEVLCLAVPFLRQGDYPAVDTAGNPYAAGVKALYSQILQRAIRCKQPGQAIIALGHLQATGSEIAEKDHSERTVIGGLECVSPEAFPPSIVYTALGHIHKSQRVSGRENIRYAGSPLPMSFAERNYRHGAVLVTIDRGELLSIEQKEYLPLVGLLSIPSGKAEVPGEVLAQLHALEIQPDPAPYLEVKILLSEPEPMLKQRIEEAVADKNVRLARIVPMYHHTVRQEMQEEQTISMGLQQMSPLEIARLAFERSYNGDMPEELTHLFQEVCSAVMAAGPAASR